MNKLIENGTPVKGITNPPRGLWSICECKCGQPRHGCELHSGKWLTKQGTERNEQTYDASPAHLHRRQSRERDDWPISERTAPDL